MNDRPGDFGPLKFVRAVELIDLPSLMAGMLSMIGYRNWPAEQRDSYYHYRYEGVMFRGAINKFAERHQHDPFSTPIGDFMVTLSDVGEEHLTVLLEGRDKEGADEFVLIYNDNVVSTRRGLIVARGVMELKP